MHDTDKDEVLTRDGPRITPSERWQSQQKTALAKLARSERPDQQVEELAEQIITGHSAVREAVRDPGAKSEGNPADRETVNAVNAEVEHRHASSARKKGKAYVIAATGLRWASKPEAVSEVQEGTR